MKRPAQNFIIIFGILFLALFGTGQVNQVQAWDGDTQQYTYLPLVVGPNGGTGGNPDPITQFINGKSGILTGIYADGNFAFPVVQQPAGNYGYVSNADDTLTQFMLPQQPVTGLLAHNYLAGDAFFGLEAGDPILLVYGDGITRSYEVHAVEQYQALDPYSPVSDFINLSTGERLTAADVYGLYYMGDEHVTLQTCISRNGNSSWGRLFVIAVPVD